ncbi:hypothetical protein DSECCO2_453980 [anaerobic digester metagenome]
MDTDAALTNSQGLERIAVTVPVAIPAVGNRINGHGGRRTDPEYHVGLPPNGIVIHVLR